MVKYILRLAKLGRKRIKDSDGKYFLEKLDVSLMG
jgi:hypothetical protein